MHVEDICTREVVSIGPAVSLIEAAETMRRGHVGTLVVCDGADGARVPIGMLTDRDIVVSAIATGLAIETLHVGDVMTRPAVTCHSSDLLFDAIAAMRRQGVRRLPVVDEHGALAGIVSAQDIWGAVADQLGTLSDAMTQAQIRETRRR